MAFEQILYQVRNRVATVTLNRPDKLNAWTAKMEEEVNSAIRGAAADENVRAIILTGAGRAFCAGADMSLLSAAAETTGTRSVLPTQDVHALDGARRDFQKKYTWLLAVPKPIIAGIHGPAVGLGFIIPLYCDLRIAADNARLCTIFAKRGLIAEFGMAWMLPRLIGLAHAADLLFTARTIDAQEALRMGLVHRVFPEAGFADALQAFAEEMASTLSPRSIRVTKQQLYNAPFETLEESFDRAAREMMASLNSEDFREGVRHYLEKRAAVFPGR
jgi:enoyl-CoA hydratase/carnithine racemase